MPLQLDFCCAWSRRQQLLPGAAVVEGIPAAVPISAVVAAPISAVAAEPILAEALRILRHTQRRIFQDGLAEA